ncbi:MAG: hypothetical protein DCC75_12055 [Proteobacteria bacterium]|nr:MAG: hypothetical protein DCC75_12055 [Pseudomonadota bacterium]
MRESTSSILVLLALTAALVSCGPTMKEWEPDKKNPHVYAISFRQTPPPESYHRLRWVHLPEPLPAAYRRSTAQVRMTPVLGMELSNLTLEQAAKELADSVNYRSYVASSVAGRTLSLNSLGTVEELAHQLARATNTRVHVDHTTRSLRFLAQPKPAKPASKPAKSVKASIKPKFAAAKEVKQTDQQKVLDPKESGQHEHK